jgi:hypothetical protein
MLMRLIPNAAWISRWAMAFVVGTTAGLSIIIYMQANVVSQMKATMVPLVVLEQVVVTETAPVITSEPGKLSGVTSGKQEGKSGVGLVKSSVEEKTIVAERMGEENKTRMTINFMKTFENLVLIIGVISALIYFFFSMEHKGVIFGGGAKLGIWVLMISFGASFGYTVMARISLLIGRMQFLMGDWLGWI